MAVGVAGYFYLQNSQLQEEKKSPFSASEVQSPQSIKTESDEMLDWKKYTGKYFTFKYPTELDNASEGGQENQAREITVSYIKPGKNRLNSDLSDGYVFKVAYGPLIGTGTS